LPQAYCEGQRHGDDIDAVCTGFRERLPNAFHFTYADATGQSGKPQNLGREETRRRKAAGGPRAMTVVHRTNGQGPQRTDGSWCLWCTTTRRWHRTRPRRAAVPLPGAAFRTSTSNKQRQRSSCRVCHLTCSYAGTTWP